MQQPLAIAIISGLAIQLPLVLFVMACLTLCLDLLAGLVQAAQGEFMAETDAILMGGKAKQPWSQSMQPPAHATFGADLHVAPKIKHLAVNSRIAHADPPFECRQWVVET